jgi:hypothetical protein
VRAFEDKIVGTVATELNFGGLQALGLNIIVDISGDINYDICGNRICMSIESIG